MGRIFESSRIGELVDVSAVKADAAQGEIDEMIRIVKQYGCICAAPMAWAAEDLLLQPAALERMRDNMARLRRQASLEGLFCWLERQGMAQAS